MHSSNSAANVTLRTLTTTCRSPPSSTHTCSPDDVTKARKILRRIAVGHPGWSFVLTVCVLLFSLHSSGPKIHPLRSGATTGVLPLPTVLAADATVLVALVVVPNLATNAISAAMASTGKGTYRIEIAKPGM